MTKREELIRIAPPGCREAYTAMEERLVNDGHLDATREAALRAHLAECADCADFYRISRHFDELPPVSTEIDSSRMIRAARASYFQRRNRRRIVLWSSAAAAAAALLLALYPVLFSANNAKTKNERNIVAGERLRLLDGRITMYSSEQTRLHTVFEDEDAMQVRVDDGFVCANIEPHPKRRVSFRVITPLGKVDVKGTAFGVTVSEGAVKVEVVRGEVAVETTASDRVYFVVAGSVFDFRTQRTARNDAGSDERIRALLGLPSAKTEVSVSLKKGMSAEAAPPASSSCGETNDTTSSPPSSPEGVARLSRPSLKKLQEEATQCRIDADWECSAKRYKEIITTYPRRGEAATALINLGQIQVKHLQQPLEARRNFEEYLFYRPSGPLSEQARYGIARANRALGDRLGEQRALELFLARHPSSSMTGLARQRLKELEEK